MSLNKEIQKFITKFLWIFVWDSNARKQIRSSATLISGINNNILFFDDDLQKERKKESLRLVYKY